MVVAAGVGGARAGTRAFGRPAGAPANRRRAAPAPWAPPHRSGPREDATRIGSAGVVRRQAVDVSPLRRVNQAIWLLTTGAREAAFRNIKTIAECLADELINAAKGSSNRCRAGGAQQGRCRGMAADAFGERRGGGGCGGAAFDSVSSSLSTRLQLQPPCAATPSRRRTSWSAWPRPTAERGRVDGAVTRGLSAAGAGCRTTRWLRACPCGSVWAVRGFG